MTVTNSRFHLEVTDRHGTTTLIVDTSQKLTARQRDRVTAVAEGLVSGIAGILGVDEDYARSVAAAHLARLAADEEAYERVAARRGVLPL